uniref:AP-3 complex subunit mu-2-like n=1 Tax=Myxine glutinosa TaxID=7769 RepID=UPI00358E1100
MIHSLFLLDAAGDVFLEKHWKSPLSRSLCDYYLEAKSSAFSQSSRDASGKGEQGTTTGGGAETQTVDAAQRLVPPVLATPHHFLVSAERGRVALVAAVREEVPPLFVIEFLHRVADTFQDYFGEVSDTVLKDQVVLVYELLEEMLDNGFPLATESNILHELIRPPTVLRSVVNAVTGSTNVGETLPSGQLSNVPWRRAGVRYSNNEAYFDVIEEIEAIIDTTGSAVAAEIQGVIDACVKLSGMPDLTLSFLNPRLLDDVSFHPCVRYKRWDAERVLSFVPPDGTFRLLSYHVGSQNLVAIPISVRHSLSWGAPGGAQGRLELGLAPRHTLGKVLEAVSMTMPLPQQVSTASLTPSQGTASLDPVSKVLTWEVGKINPQKPPSLRGSISLSPGSLPPDGNPTLSLSFRIPQLAISGLKVTRLDLYGEKYKPFKGVKYVSKAGRFHVRI